VARDAVLCVCATAHLCACTENGAPGKSGVSGTTGATTHRNPAVASGVLVATRAARRQRRGDLSCRNHRRLTRQRHRLHRLVALGRASDSALSTDPTCVITNQLCLHGQRHIAIGDAFAPEGLRISLGGQHG